MDYHAVLKEWYWGVIYAALIAVAFAPTLLKTKCPTCKKRKLETVDIDQRTRETLQQREDAEFLTFYRCTACGARLMRERTAPYKDAGDARWNLAYDNAFTTIVS
jgi:hypothetical protein